MPMTRTNEGEIKLNEDLVEIVDYDPVWRELFLVEKARLERAFMGLALGIEHIGSTSVPGLAAKPVIDILVAIEAALEADELVRVLATLGYVHVPQDDRDRTFFRKGMPRTHHVHVVRAGSWAFFSHVWFRDFLVDHPSAAEEYELLKRVLAARHRSDRAAYVKGKDAMVSMILDRAVKERLIVPRDPLD
jgi:GrpB-like predicted nucleotidyltransferase (UPF0157 family)